MELMIICVLISVLSALAIPSWMNYLPKMRAKSAVRAAVSGLREARALSIAEKKRFGVYFDSNNKNFVLFADIINPGGGTYDTGDSVVTRTDFGSNVVLGSTSLAGATVVFDMIGAASQSGTVVFTTSDAQLSYTIDVLAATGRIKMIAG
jgi:Tfp pilus assembly protein FimT